jgi:serine phosphatase RsbU (regulator of sigma subunit)
MAQARGLLRGISQTLAGSPAAVLDALDRALENLRMRTLITLTLATVHLDPADGPALLRWSNAGHPPPVVVRAGGATELLARRPDRLLGFGADACRSDHEVSLAPGDTVVFYTDGLVERRGVPIDDGIAWLVRELARHGARPLEELCDCVLAGLAGGVDDDVAVLAVRVRDRAVVGHPAPP